MLRLVARVIVLSWGGLLALILPFTAHAATQRTQSIALQAGWNAVFIEVEPADTAPAVVFAGAPVEIVSTYYADRSPVEFLRDPAEQAWTDAGWSTWYAPSRQDAFLSKLHAIQANRPYLIKATAAYTLNLLGEVKFSSLEWQPNSLNLVGFHVDPAAPPTFATFFAGSEAHTGQSMYKLVSGHWKPVTNLSGEPVRAGQAYWVGCAKGSIYQGPLTVTIPYGDKLDFGAQASVQTIQLVNTGTVPLAITVTDSGQTLPQAYRVYDPITGETTYHGLPPSLNLGTIEAGGTTSLTLMVKREQFTQSKQSTVLKIAADNGVVIHLAVTADKLAD